MSTLLTCDNQEVHSDGEPPPEAAATVSWSTGPAKYLTPYNACATCLIKAIQASVTCGDTATVIPVKRSH